jgi:predicted RNase H-like HicB family nuclease
LLYNKNNMPIFVKNKKLKKVKSSNLDTHSGQWVAVQGEDEVVSYGQTIEEIMDEVKIEGKTIEDNLPDPREHPTAVKLPERKRI